MRKPITPFAHGVLDYATAATMAAAPRLLSFPKRAALACYALAGDITSSAMLTDYPLGVKRVIPFKAHGAMDAFMGAVLPTLPMALGFWNNRPARNFFLGVTALMAASAVLTDWNKDSQRIARRRHRRKPRLVRHVA